MHPALIGRYIGSRDELVVAVFGDLSAQVSAAVLEHPLSGQGFGADTVMGKWARIAARWRSTATARRYLTRSTA